MGSRFMGTLKYILGNFEEILSVILLSIVCLLIALQVFCRYVLRSPLVWSEELTRYTFIWLSFIGAVFALKRRAHISVEALVRVLPQKLQVFLEIIVNLGIVAGLLVIIPNGFSFSKFMLRIGSSAMGIPMGFLYLALPLSFSLMVIHLAIAIVRAFRALVSH